MEYPIIVTRDYTVYEADESILWQLATFVVEENYRHHGNNHILSTESLQETISKVYEEEYGMSSASRILIVRDNAGRMIGSIRSTL